MIGAQWWVSVLDLERTSQSVLAMIITTLFDTDSVHVRSGFRRIMRGDFQLGAFVDVQYAPVALRLGPQIFYPTSTSVPYPSARLDSIGVAFAS